MGITSSQVEHPSVAGSDMALKVKSNGTEAKSRKHKRKSGEIDHTQELEEEDGRASSQSRGLEAADEGASIDSDDLAASQQYVLKSSQYCPPGTSSIAETGTRSSQKTKKQVKSKKRVKKRKRHSADMLVPTDSKDCGEQPEYFGLPSTPPGQTDHSSPSPFRPSASRSQHALDQVPTDDETAVFDQEFGNANPDIYSFSQQPPEDPAQHESMSPTYQLPTPGDASPKPPKRNKKRKRQGEAAPVIASEERMPWENGAGQPTVDYDLDLQHYDTLFVNDENSANPIDVDKGDEVPIDPELHSISTLPPAVDLSALDDGNVHIKQPKTSRSNLNGSSQPRKRRRIEKLRFPIDGQNTNNMPSSDQENIQDRVLPGLEDMQRRSSPELGAPFMENHAWVDAGYQKSSAKSAKSSKQKKLSATPVESGQTKSQSGPSLKDVAEKGGPWADAEIAKVDRFRDKYCEANNMNYSHFNDLIQSNIRANPQARVLFNELYEVVPYRPRASLQKFVKRRFHNYSARGTWSAEDDEMLKRAVKEKGTSWKAVGEMIERMPEDCRDRWRNYLVNSEHRNREQWTDDEVRNLCTAILECTQLMKDERRQAREDKYGLGAPEVDEEPDQEDEDIRLLNWQAVSDRMGEHGGGRSRLQCSLKWGNLKKIEQNNLLHAVRGAQGCQAKRPAITKNPWRSRRAFRKVANMKMGDRYRLLQIILGSNASTEGNIPWKTAGDDKFRAIWTSSDMKLAWTDFKETVPNFQSMDYREIANRLIRRILAEGKEAIHQTWDPSIDGDVTQQEVTRQRKARREEKEEAKKSKRKGSYQRGSDRKKSDEFVQESDDEDEAEANTANDTQEDSQSSASPEAEKANGYADTFDPVSTVSEAEEEVHGDEEPQDSDQDSLFNDPIEDIGNQPQQKGGVSPILAKKVQLLQFA